MKRILLCPPTYYAIEYEINPWMHVENKVDTAKVLSAYQNLKNLYQSLSTDVYEIDAEYGLPDMVYTANFGQVCNGVFIPANFKYQQRRKESLIATEYFKQKFGYESYQIPENIFFEGQGDLLQNDQYYFMGWGKRSDRGAKNHLVKILDKPIIDLELVDPYYYHLDTCFAPLTTDLALINPTSFTPEGLEKIHHLFKTIIVPSPEDHRVLACNLVCIDNKIIVAQGISQNFKDELSKYGYTIYEIDTTEYRKGGGSIKCLSFEF